jgi:two-component system, NtrC family, sensor histidine kinase KinB
MLLKRLQARFVLAGALLVLISVGSSSWSAWTFARLSAHVGETLRDSQATIDSTTALASSLEREDDALLLALSGNVGVAREQLAAERRRGEEHYRALVGVVKDDEIEELALARQLRGELDEYRKAGSDLIDAAGDPDSLKRYHERVNPLLREAVATCAKLREANFREMQLVGLRARDEAHRATWVVVAVSIAGLLSAIVVAVWLARSIVVPIRELTDCVEALRLGDFDRRARVSAIDELDRLADGFNRMAESLSEYRQSSLGELLTAKMTLEATLNALPDAVFVIAPDGELVAVNPPGKAVLDAKRAPTATRLQELPLSAEHRDAVDRALAGHRSNGSRADFGHTLQVMLSGRPHRLHLTAIPIPEFLPRRTGAVVVLDDVTEFARLDELRSELIGVASHELKTPLTTLRMNLLLLAEKSETLTSRQQESLAGAIGGCEELESTIDELLDVTRIEAGQLRLNLAPVDLIGLLDRVLKPLRARIADAGVQVVIERSSASATILADAARLGIVFTNLLTNALEYSPHHETVTIKISSRQNAGGDAPPTLQVAVTDAGRGVPAEFRERIFEKFFRVEHHLGQDRDGVRGTGIGLYLCREIVQAHGGWILCEAGENGVGTRIAISLPYGL